MRRSSGAPSPQAGNVRPCSLTRPAATSARSCTSRTTCAATPSMAWTWRQAPRAAEARPTSSRPPSSAPAPSGSAARLPSCTSSLRADKGVRQEATRRFLRGPTSQYPTPSQSSPRPRLRLDKTPRCRPRCRSSRITPAKRGRCRPGCGRDSHALPDRDAFADKLSLQFDSYKSHTSPSRRPGRQSRQPRDSAARTTTAHLGQSRPPRPSPGTTSGRFAHRSPHARCASAAAHPASSMPRPRPCSCPRGARS